MKFFKKNLLIILIFLGFFLSRFYILNNPPPYYSDVNHDYQRYANMWRGGLTPYLKHFYEYPPATLPILYFPLMVDQWGIGQYYQNYRVQAFAFDLLFFIFILKAILSLKISKKSKTISLLFYLLAPIIAKDFFYEGLDLIFSGTLALAIIGLLFYSQKKFFKRVLFYSLFWLSTSIKFLTAPLMVFFFYLKKLEFKKELKAFVLGFLIIWAIPLAIFRSSLSVMFVFHTRRALKYASFPSFIVETINYWTNSEERFNQAPDFQLMGPISMQAEKIVDIVFPLSILLVLIYSLFIILKPNFKKLLTFLNKAIFFQKFSLSHINPYMFSLKISLIYIFTIFLTGKVFSQPFHIWFIPLIALFPFKSIKRQLGFISLATWLLIIDTTPWISIDEGIMVAPPLPSKFFIYLARFLPMFVLLIMSLKLPNKHENKIK